MAHLIGLLHGGEETFPPALLACINAFELGVQAESVLVGGVEALESSPYSLLVDRLSSRVGYFRSFLEQQRQLGVLCLPSLELQNLDRIGLAQVALHSQVPCWPTLLLPHQAHPSGVDSQDLTNLAYPLPWEQYLGQVGLPAQLRSARLGPGSLTKVESLSQLWQVYGRSGCELLVLQPSVEAPQCLVIVVGKHLEILGYDPIAQRYRAPDPNWIEPASRAVQSLRHNLDLNLTGVVFSWSQEQLWLDDLQLLPDLDWWNLGEAPFERIVQACAAELITRVECRLPQNQEVRK